MTESHVLALATIADASTERPESAPTALKAGEAASSAPRAAKCLTAWLRACRKRSRNTARSYKSTAGRFCQWIQQNKGMPLDNALRHSLPSDISAWLSLQGGSAATSAQRLACLRSMFRALVADGCVQSNSAREVKPESNLANKVEHHKPIPLATLKKVLRELGKAETVAAMRDRLIITLGCSLGLRRCEIAKLRISDVCLTKDNPVLRIRGKGRRIDVMPLSKRMIACLRKWLDSRAAYDDENAPLFYSLAPGRLPAQGLSLNGVHRIIKQHFPKRSMHSLRVNCLTQHYRSGGSIEHTRLWGRHENEATTRIYIRVNEMREAAEHAPDFSDAGDNG